MSISRLVLDVLLGLVFLKVAGLVVSGFIVLRLGASRKISNFWKEYWNWRYVRENVVNLVVWVVTLCGYASSYHVLSAVPTHSVSWVFNHHPIVASYTIAATLWLVFSTVVQTVSNVRHTAALCEKIGHPSLIKKLGKWAVVASLFYLETTSWPFLVGTLVGVVLPSLILKYAVDRKLSKAIEQFIFLALIEYAFRVSVVLSALYAETGALRLW